MLRRGQFQIGRERYERDSRGLSICKTNGPLWLMGAQVTSMTTIGWSSILTSRTLKDGAPEMMGRHVSTAWQGLLKLSKWCSLLES